MLMLLNPFTVGAPFTPLSDYRDWTTYGAPLVARFNKILLELAPV